MCNYSFCIFCRRKVVMTNDSYNKRNYGLICNNFINNNFILCNKFYCLKCVNDFKRKSIYGDYIICLNCDKIIKII